jgi:hypothetical protein
MRKVARERMSETGTKGQFYIKKEEERDSFIFIFVNERKNC